MVGANKHIYQNELQYWRILIKRGLDFYLELRWYREFSSLDFF